MGKLIPKITLLFLITVTVYSEVSDGGVPSERDKKLYYDIKSGRGLYGSDDKVTVLNSTYFKSSVYGTKNAWLVEFYNSWCGFCHRFVPTWKALAADIHGWEDVVKLAVVDCSNDENTPVCREYEVMYYPMLKFFPAESQVGFLGTEVKKQSTMTEIRHSLVHILQKEQLSSRGTTWPNISPYRSSEVKNLWRNSPTSVEFIILVFQRPESFSGTEVILDLHGLEQVLIRTVLNQNEALMKLMGVSEDPSVVAIDRNDIIYNLKIQDDSRESLHKAIKEFLNMHNIRVPDLEVIKDPGNWENEDPFNIDDVMVQEAEEERRIAELKKMGDVVFQIDLENAVRYTLHHEIAGRKLIWGESLNALTNYVGVLRKYFPADYHGATFFSRIETKLKSVTEISGVAFVEHLERLESEMTHVFYSKAPVDWVGCKGSRPNYRGFPCGLWMLFHTLTVKKATYSHSDNLEVLNAMLGYVTHFFGCQDCSKHFQEMASELTHLEVTNPSESVLWLWKSHNTVNNRLSGDATEDPKFAKIQFPSQVTCPLCRNADGSWNKHQVFRHLKNMYSKENIHFMGLDLQPRLENASGQINNSRLKDTIEIEQLDVVKIIEKEDGRGIMGWNFNVFDISLCVVLYASSAMILTLVCVKFVMRRGYRKKAYVHDLLGKV